MGQISMEIIRLPGSLLSANQHYYDLDMTGGSPDPANPDVTMRMMTVMMAWEY
jgi:hypothetical protein